MDSDDTRYSRGLSANIHASSVGKVLTRPGVGQAVRLQVSGTRSPAPYLLGADHAQLLNAVLAEQSQ